MFKIPQDAELSSAEDQELRELAYTLTNLDFSVESRIAQTLRAKLLKQARRQSLEETIHFRRSTVNRLCLWPMAHFVMGVCIVIGLSIPITTLWIQYGMLIHPSPEPIRSATVLQTAQTTLSPTMTHEPFSTTQESAPTPSPSFLSVRSGVISNPVSVETPQVMASITLPTYVSR